MPLRISLYICAIQWTLGIMEGLPEALKSGINPLSLPAFKEQPVSRIDRFFNVLDADKNGTIDISELKMWIENSYRSDDRTRAENKLRSCDENSDGYLSFEEHLQCTFGLSAEELVHRVDPNLETTVRVAKAEQVRFNGVDKNRDRRLSLSELMLFLSPQHYPSMADVELQVGLTRYDNNHDGIVTLDEFLSTSGTQNSNELDDLVDQFTKLDKNHDNRLTLDELKQWLFPNISSIAAVEAKNIFAIVDADNDGRISTLELRSRASAFAHKPFTSYPGTSPEEF
ncbi:Calumenin [Clonorchis sinensis]|uniref:Calumenin n=1 Tax=Clonorchis sinensis TaxID=79923 RepID=A0A3R7GU29_CLOSI|nr:Calumenin [Clonorchis sinensis]